MVDANGVTTNVQLEKFEGLRGNYGTWLMHFKLILMVRNLEVVILPEFKNELPKTDTSEGKTQDKRM